MIRQLAAPPLFLYCRNRMLPTLQPAFRQNFRLAAAMVFATPGLWRPTDCRSPFFRIVWTRSDTSSATHIPLPEWKLQLWTLHSKPETPAGMRDTGAACRDSPERTAGKTLD